MTIRLRRFPDVCAALCASVLCLVAHNGVAAGAKFQARPLTSIAIETVAGDGVVAAGPTFRGALEMRWEHKRFGGFSGLHVDPAGRRFTAVSDRGAWLQADLVYVSGRLVGARNAKFKRLRDPGGKKLKGAHGDAEALSSDGAGGFIVAFERRHRFLHYPGWRRPFLLRPRQIAPPQGLRGYNPNHGVEAMTRLCDGRYMAIVERGDGKGGADNVAWFGVEDVWTRRLLTRNPTFRISGATLLPNCSIALLERRQHPSGRWITRIRRLSVGGLEAGGVGPLEGPVILGPFLSSAKFEGVAVHRTQRQSEVLLLIEDNDFKGPTVLAAFAIDSGR